MLSLDYYKMQRNENEILIPFANDPCARIRLNTKLASFIVEHEYCDEYIDNEKTNEEWRWVPAPQQPDESIIHSIIQEYRRYAEDEIAFQNAV